MEDSCSEHGVWRYVWTLDVNKYLKFLKCFDISLQSSRNIHQNRIVMLRNVYVCATELPFNSSRMPAVRELEYV